MNEQSGPIVMSKRSLLNIKQTEKSIENGQISQLPSVLDMSNCSHYCAIVFIKNKSSLRRRMMKTGDGRFLPGQTVMMM